MTSEEFATRFLEEEKVAAVPGTAFGDSGEGILESPMRTPGEAEDCHRQTGTFRRKIKSRTK